MDQPSPKSKSSRNPSLGRIDCINPSLSPGESTIAALSACEKISNKNSTTIQQIGDYNFLSTYSKFENGIVEYYQIGNFNIIESQSSISNLSETIVQEGNNNSAYNYTFGNVKSDELELMQSGNNLIFERFGTNSLTDNIKVKMQGNAKTIIIRSF